MNETFIVPRGICFALKRATLNISTDKLMIKKKNPHQTSNNIDVTDSILHLNSLIME